jgi:malonyl-CoA O-methyltransferase
MAEDFSLRVDKRLMRRAFERAAPSYDAAALLQREVGQRLVERLDWVKLAPARVLDAGCGTGGISRALALRYPEAQVLGLDIAAGMLRMAHQAEPWWRRKLPFLSRHAPLYVGGDLERLPLADSSVQLLCSNLALQWSNDLAATFAELRRVLAPGGLLMFSTFGPDTLRELRQAFAGLDAYTHVNRFMDMHDIGDELTYAGFATPVVDMEFITLTYTDLMSLLRELKAIGAHNVTTGRGHGLMGKNAWRGMLANYEKLRRDGRLPATYEVIYGHAWVNEKMPKTPTTTDDGRQVIQWQIQARQTGLR